MLSSTDDFPELCIRFQTLDKIKPNSLRSYKRQSKKTKILKKRTWPPTTATEGRASQSVGKAESPPQSPSTVHALCILLTNPIKLSIVAIISISLSSKTLPVCSFEFELITAREQKKTKKLVTSRRIKKAILKIFFT